MTTSSTDFGVWFTNNAIESKKAPAEPDDGILGVGSGGNYALAAARALMPDPNLSAKDMVQRSMEIAADICIYTNRHLTILEL